MDWCIIRTYGSYWTNGYYWTDRCNRSRRYWTYRTNGYNRSTGDYWPNGCGDNWCYWPIWRYGAYRRNRNWS